MSFFHIRLEMARTPEFPKGNPNRGYEFSAPLDKDGHLDKDAWEQSPDKALVTRFWDGERAALGKLVYQKNGWAFDYDPGNESDDETGFRLASHLFNSGEYVSIYDHGEDELHTFVVKSVSLA